MQATERECHTRTDGDLVGGEVAQLNGKRPPPSKSTTAKMMGGLGEYATRSTVNVATVPSTAASGAGSMVSVRMPSVDTRDGG